MAQKPIFVATHPRACSTAFERVFMTRRDTLVCAHEPFGDSFYYGPERLGERYEQDPKARQESGFTKTTYQDVLNRLEQDGREGKRVFIKDMAYYLMPADGKTADLAPSVSSDTNGATNGTEHVNGSTNASTNGTKHINGTNGSTNGSTNGASVPENPTVLPLEVLKQFHWTFLIRHPRRGIPSYYRCTIPPLDEATGFKYFLPNEAGYVELRKLFDYLRAVGLVGPELADQTTNGIEKTNGTNGTNGTHTANGAHDTNGTNGVNGKQKGGVPITMIDADDLLDHPQEVIEAFCKQTGIDFDPDMLVWDNPDDQQFVKDAFEKWNGFHNDAISSTSLTARTTHKKVTEESENEEWRQKYGEEGRKIIRACVDENIPHYEYLKQFAMKF